MNAFLKIGRMLAAIGSRRIWNRVLPLLVIALLATGCSSTKSSGIKSDRYNAELYAAMHRAEAKLGKKWKGGEITVSQPICYDKTKNGWYGNQRSFGIQGGSSYGKHTSICLAPGKGQDGQEGKFQDYLAELEFGHRVANTGSEQGDYDLMRKAGYRW